MQKYIKEQNKKGKKLVGGIIAQKRKGDEILYLNDSDIYNYDAELTSWKFLDL